MKLRSDPHVWCKCKGKCTQQHKKWKNFLALTWTLLHSWTHEQGHCKCKYKKLMQGCMPSWFSGKRLGLCLRILIFLVFWWTCEHHFFQHLQLHELKSTGLKLFSNFYLGKWLYLSPFHCNRWYCGPVGWWVSCLKQLQ